MASLVTRWLGFELPSPFVVAASPITQDLDLAAAAVDAGAGAVVLPSLFEEQLAHEQMSAHRFIDAHLDMDAESRGIFPSSRGSTMDVEPYLRDLARMKERVAVPVLASLNGTTPGGWVSYAKHIESAGADALELNLYDVAPSANESGAEVEARQLELVRAVVATVRIPVTVKLSAFYASLPAFCLALERAGVRGVSVFNRYYQPDIDVEELDVDRRIVLSTSAELPLRLHALARLSPQTSLDLACTGGVHTGVDAAKAILSGAHVVQLASVLLARGPAHVGVLRDELLAWLDAKGYASITQARGILDLRSAPDPHAWERLNYARMLAGWRPRSRSATTSSSVTGRKSA
jgi:dihydroorotate dehydrogenase (fumarate)